MKLYIHYEGYPEYTFLFQLTNEFDNLKKLKEVIFNIIIYIKKLKNEIKRYLLKNIIINFL